MDSRIGMYSSMRESIGVALNYFGYSLNTLDSGELDQAKNLLIDQRKNVRPLVGIDELKDKYVSGELLAGVVWSGDHVVCQIRLEEAQEDPDKLQYVLPKGSNLSVDMLCVPQNAANPDGAHDFINFLYEPEIALINAVYVGYSTPHTEALKGLPAEMISNLAIPTKSIKVWRFTIPVRQSIPPTIGFGRPFWPTKQTALKQNRDPIQNEGLDPGF